MAFILFYVLTFAAPPGLADIKATKRTPPNIPRRITSVKTDPDLHESEKLKSSNENRPLTPRTDKSRVGIFLGVSSSGGMGAVAGGLEGHFPVWGFLKCELFGFHDLFDRTEDFLFSSSEPWDEGKQFGASANLKLEFPITAGPIEVFPRIGTGIGIRDGGSIYFWGPTALMGFGVEISNLIRIKAEYTRGIGGYISSEVAEGGSMRSSGTEFENLAAGLGLRLGRAYILEITYGQSTLVTTRRGLTYLTLSYEF